VGRSVATDLGERNPGATEGSGAYTGLLDAVGRVFMVSLFLLKYFISFVLPFISLFKVLQNIFNKKMQAA
jgi:hypothetical protein